KLFFMLASIWKGLQSDTIILSHINLLIIVPFIKFLSPKTKIILYAHGIEIWDSLPLWKREILQNDLEIWAVSNFTANKIALTHQINKTHIKILNNAIDPYFHWPKYFEKPAQLLKRFKLDANQPILY